MRYNTLPHLILKGLRRIVYPRLATPYKLPDLTKEMDLDKSNDIIFDLLSTGKPCMVARFGSCELSNIVNYIFVKGKKKNIIKYIQGYGWEWWWNMHSMEQLMTNAGFWPINPEMVSKFAQLQIDDANCVDILGSWKKEEYYLYEELINATRVDLFNLEPFFSERPWTRILKGKKVLVVSPFVETIKKQYAKREKLFNNPDILPEFDLVSFRAVQSINGNPDYENWFEALKYMEDEIDRLNFDVAILGCGAYGFSLAAHIKRTGKQAIHMGGVTQILFGIKGNRWINPVKSMCGNGYYPDLFNEYWTRPAESETPQNAKNVEGGCYW